MVHIGLQQLLALHCCFFGYICGLEFFDEVWSTLFFDLFSLEHLISLDKEEA